jgi:2'-5' RNA ligase
VTARDAAPSEGARSLRLFVAIGVPAEIRDVVAEAVRPVRADHADARWVPIENQHVTLQFLGATSPVLVDRVTEALDEVTGASTSFPTRVEGLGVFPNTRRARVLWAGLDDAQGRMAELSGALAEALRREFPPDERTFTPHLTLARFEPHVALSDLPPVVTDRFDVDRVILFRSHLRRPALRYEPLATFPLGG